MPCASYHADLNCHLLPSACSSNGAILLHCDSVQDALLWLCPHLDRYLFQLYLQLHPLPPAEVALEEASSWIVRYLAHCQCRLVHYRHHWGARHAVCLLPVLASQCHPYLASLLTSAVLHSHKHDLPAMHWSQALQDTYARWLDHLLGCHSQHSRPCRQLRQKRWQSIHELCPSVPGLFLLRCPLTCPKRVNRAQLAPQPREVQLQSLDCSAGRGNIHVTHRPVNQQRIWGL